LRLVFSPPWTGRAALLSLLILALALCASASGLCPPAQDPAHRSNRDKIVVGTLAPFRVRGLLAKLPSGETGGFALELTRAAAAAVGLEVEFKEVDDHETALRLLIDSSIDLICLLSVTDERMPLVEFSTPLLIAHGAVFSRIGDTPATTAEALSKVGVTVAGAGVAHQWCIEQSIPVMVEPSLQVALERVVRGEARYCLTTQIAGRVDVEDHKIVGLVDHPLEDERISRAFALATRKGETELRFDLNKGLAIVRDNGRWDQLYDEWVARYQPRPRRPYVTRSAVLWGGGILFALMSAGLLSQWLLRRQISRRTSELRQSEAMYRAIAEDLPALVYTYFVSDDGRRAPRYISPQAAEWRRSFPYLEPGQEWKSYLDRVHPDDQQGFFAAAETAQAKRARFDRECQLVAQDGSYRWVHILVTPFPAEGGTLWQGLLLDVTPLRETEQALRASEQKYRVIFERSQDALLLVDPRTLTLRSMNAAACKLYGYSNAELVGSPLARIQALGQLGPQVIAEVCSGVARTGIRDAHTQRDGTRIEVEISVAAMVLENETLVLAEVRDISERMRLELQLFQAQKLEGLGVLAGGIAHDFNNLMGGILGNIELARADQVLEFHRTGGSVAEFLLPERAAFFSVRKDSGGFVFERLAKVTFGCVPERRQRCDVFFVIQFNRAQERVDARQQFASPLLSRVAHSGEKRMLHRAGKSDAHVVGDAGLARRIDHARAELWNEHARFHARHGLESDEPSRLQEFDHRIEDVEVHEPGHREP
jgi:PAS domain S-box-containing protein